MAVEHKPLMPKATAVWLVDNTALSFEQIADFCGLHPLEVKGIADEDVAKGIKGQDPVATGQLTREQIAEAEKDPRKRLKMAPAKHKMPSVRLKRAPRYTPVSKRQDKPDAVYWLIRNHAEFSDSDIIKLIGTTKSSSSCEQSPRVTGSTALMLAAFQCERSRILAMVALVVPISLMMSLSVNSGWLRISQ